MPEGATSFGKGAPPALVHLLLCIYVLAFMRGGGFSAYLLVNSLGRFWEFCFRKCLDLHVVAESRVPWERLSSHRSCQTPP